MSSEKEEDDHSGKPYIVGINASPREDGQSAKNLERVLQTVRKEGGCIKTFNLARLNIMNCDGAYSTNPKLCTFPCGQEDDMRQVHRELLAAEGFVLTVPTWWSGPGPYAENFLAKLNALENNGFLLEGKVAGVIGSAGMLGSDMVVSRIIYALVQMGVIIVPYGAIATNSVIAFLEEQRAVVKVSRMLLRFPKEALTEFPLKADLEGLAKNMLRMIRLLKQNPGPWS